MQYTATVGDRQYSIESDVSLTGEQVINYALQNMYLPPQVQSMQGGCPSCRGQAVGSGSGGIPKLGTATCGGPYIQNSTHTLTGSVVSGGTSPFTYTWTITPPTGIPETLNGSTQSYRFIQAGVYHIALSVRDSCPAGGLTDTAACDVTISPTCNQPSCKVSLI